MSTMEVSLRPEPVEPRQRIAFLDLLRGVAMLLILVENIALYSGQTWDLQQMEQPVERATLIAIKFLSEAKSYTLLAFLFGWGVAVQQERIEALGRRYVPFYLRRMGFLSAVGLIHGALIWSGDVLLLYALLGLALLAFRRSSARTLLVAAVICLSFTVLLNLPGAGMDAVRDAYAQATAVLRPGGEPASVYATGRLAEIARRRIHDWLAYYSWAGYYAGTVLGVFLLGSYAARRHWLRDMGQHRRAARQVMWVSLGLGLIANELYVETYLGTIGLPQAHLRLMQVATRTAGALTFVTFYVTMASLAMRSDRLQRALRPVCEVGRCSLSNYLLQSMICTTVFYSYGLGLYGQVGIVFSTVTAVLVYLGELRMSGWWLDRHPLGPMEWLWRVVTYGRSERLSLRRAIGGLASPAWAWIRCAVGRVDRRLYYVGAALLVLGGVGLGVWRARQHPIEVAEPARRSAIRVTSTPAGERRPAGFRVATPVVQPVTYAPGAVASTGNLAELASTFDAGAALAEIRVLTGPPYLGRYPASAGGHAAGEYIAQRFAEYGLQPAGDDGTYFQPFAIEYVVLQEEPTLIVETQGGIRTEYVPYRDFSPMAKQYAGEGEARGGVVWGSRCVADDLSAVDVVGKVVLCRDGPVVELERLVLEYGGTGLLVMTDPSQRLPDFRVTFGEAWVPRPLVAFRVYPSVVEGLLTGSGYTAESLSSTYASFPLATELEARLLTAGREACPAAGCMGRNVLGVLPGRDAGHRHEVVILGAHYDHLGESPSGTQWVGANDNASGVAVLLEIARAWSAEGYVPRRTVLFAAWDAEEMGLLGSQHYVEQPRYPLTDTVGMLQLDMVGAGGDLLEIDGEPAMGERLGAIAEERGIEAEQTRTGGSDHVPFWRAGIPASLLIWSSGEGATPDYHRPTDTAVVIEIDKLESAGEVAGIALLGLAEGELGIDDMLVRRAAAAQQGDLDAFLATSASSQRQGDRYWYDDLRSLAPTSVRMAAHEVYVCGETATGSVQIVVTYPDGTQGSEKTLTAILNSRFEYTEGGWRWAGPDLAQSQPEEGGFTVWYPPDLDPGPAGLGRAAAARYAQITAQLGLPPETEAQIELLPDSRALQASTALGGSFEDSVWVGPGTVRMVYTAQITGTERFDDALVQLVLANTGVSADAAPWLWRGLPLLLRAELGHEAPRLLGPLQDALGSEADTDSEAMSWAAVSYMREKVGWSGVGEFVARLGRTCLAAGCAESEVDAALAGVLDLQGAGLAAAWQGYWATELERMQVAVDGVLSARAEAVLARDPDAFMDTVDEAVPGLWEEQAAWFRDAADRAPTDASLAGRLLGLDGASLLALVEGRYSWAGAAEGVTSGDLSFQTVVSFTPSAHGFKWSGPVFRSLTGVSVTLMFPAGLSGKAQILHEAAEAAYGELCAALTIDPPAPVVVKLYDQRDTFLSVVPPSSAQAGAGSAWTGRGAPVQLLLSANCSVEQDQEALMIQLARHLLRQVGVEAEWVLKGASLYLAAGLDPRIVQPAASQLGALLDVVERQGPPGLWEMPPDYALTEEALSLAEAQAWDTVRYLAEQYGDDAPRALVRALGAGLEGDAALRAAIGRGTEELCAEWAASLARGHARREWEAVALQFDAGRAHGDVAYLSAEAFGGRQAGSEGAAAAAAYIASRFAEYGLEPAVALGGASSFEQRFPISYTALLEAPVLELLGQRGEVLEPLTYRADFVDLLHLTSGGGDAEGEAVWIADAGYAGIELAGKVAVRVASLPIEAEVAQAAEHGAGALLLVSKTAGQKLPFAKPALPVTLEGERSIPVLELTRQGAQRLLDLAGQSMAALQGGAPATPLGVRVRVRIALDGPRSVEATNILGLLPGSDPSVADEAILVSAHYDSVGDDPPVWVCPSGVSAATSGREAMCARQTGTRYPGANDNASGVAVMLEIARLWQEADYHPRRAVVFAAWAAHEAGQAGISHYIQAPVVPLEDLVAVLQLEAVGGGAGYYLGAEGDKSADGLLRFTMERAEALLDGRLSLSSPPARADPVSAFREAGVPALRLRWREASDENWPVQYADEVQPYRLGVTGRMVTLTLMVLAGEGR